VHHKKTQVSCRKEKASQKVWQWLDRQWIRVLPRIAQDLQGTQVKCMEYTSRSLEIVSKETLCQRGKTEEECEASDKDDW
jgi:hypothetical protein